jgi:hypothetical protein
MAIIVLAGGAAASRGRFDAPGSAFGVVGARAERGYFRNLPWETVDLVNGNLMLTFTDLLLPGNAGMDLLFTHTYNHQTSGNKWTFGFAGVPTAAILPASPAAPSLFMPDGSAKALHTAVVSGYWITTDFWRFDTSARTLYLPNGWVATYDAPAQGSDWAWLHEVRRIRERDHPDVGYVASSGERGANRR